MSLRFDGIDDRATCGVNLGGYRCATIAMWCAWDQSYANDDDFLMEYTPDTNTNNGFYIDPHASAATFTVQLADLATGSGSYGWRHNRSAFPINTWHHLVLVISYPAQGIALYIDGAYVTPSATTGALVNANATFSSSMFYLFHRGSGPALFGAGRMAELSIWAGNSNVFSDAQVLQLYRGASPFDIPMSTMELLGYFPMDNVYDGYRNRVPKKHSPVAFSGGQPTNAPHDMPVNLSTSVKGTSTYGASETTVSGPGVSATTVLVDISVSSAEVTTVSEAATVTVDIQVSGPDGVTHFDASTVLVDIGIHTCEWYVPVPPSEFIFWEYTKWSQETETKWSQEAYTRWYWAVQVREQTPEEICT